MGQIIDIGTKINLEILLRSKLYIQADSGGGKSYAMRKTVESVGSKVQQIILDAEGDFVTLREEFNFALVSKDGDIPLSVEYAETLALKILETNISVIIDLYELKAHQRLLFVQRFLNALMNAPKTLWHDCLVYIDEADIFCPQGDEKTDHARAVIDFCTRGRKRGYAAVLATQRISLVSKSALAQCRNKLIGLCTLDIDQKRAGAELGFTDKQKILGLRNLDVGEFYVFGPAISREVKKIKIAKVITSHPEPGKRIVKAPPTPDAIKKILSKLKDIPEEAEKELKTKQDLLNRIKGLEVELRNVKSTAPKTAVASKSTDETKLRNEIIGLKQTVSEKESIIKHLKNFQLLALQYIQKTDQFITDVKNKVQDAVDNLPVLNTMAAPKNLPRASSENIPIEKKPEKPLRQQTRVNQSSEGSDIQAGPHKMLKVLAMLYPEEVSKERLSMLSGYSITSSTFGIYIRKLVEPGYIVKAGDGYKITEAGLEAVGPYETMPTDSDTLISYWKGKLEAGPGKMFEILCGHWPHAITKEELSEQSGYSLTSSTFGIYVRKLRTLKLITEPDKLLKASDALFQNV